MFLLPEPPPEIRLVPWFSPQVDLLASSVEIEAYSADIMAGAKRLRHLKPPATREHLGRRYIIVMDESEPIAVYRVVPERPTEPERLLQWPFDDE